MLVSPPETLVTTYLHMTPADFRPTPLSAPPGAQIVRLTEIDVEFYRFLYNTVGEDYRWRDRRLMSNDELYAAITAPGVSIYVLYVGGIPAGYVELSRTGDETEVAYFGLRPSYIGRGLGKYLLHYGIERAWESYPQRVWVHTCNLDGPHALDNYLKRGFKVYEVHEKPMPERYL
jgi:GNAT superfamily N-acetyltransferase